ncbi:hypothetical protein RintRC_0679 [Richelia intracellularis]|nr:hypothetical protein RintRC_0679 [Richelia intracellularis]
MGLQSAFSTAKRWDEKQPLMALFLGQIAESDSQQDPIFKTSIAYTRLTATSALEKLKEQGFTQEQLPCTSTMAQVLNRMGYGLRKVVKPKPQKKLHKWMISSTTSNNLSRNQPTSLKVKRLSMDCKVPVNIGSYSRGGKTRGENQAEDMIWDAQKKILPVGFLMKIVGNYCILSLVVLLIKPGILLLIL